MKLNKTSNGMCNFHNVRFYNLAPRAITNLCYNKITCKLALARNDASIEIWDLRSNSFYLEKSILSLIGASIEAIVWVGDRLISGGLAGEITEWNLRTLEPEKSLLVTGTSVWCLDVNRTNTLVAVGTEVGYINLFNCEDGLLFEKILDKQEGRVLCCKFDHTGEFLVTGSIDAVRVWNLKSGHAIHKMSTLRSDMKTETVVWALEVLKDFTIVSGDSRGRLTFWDGKLGAQIESIPASKADILCIALNETEDTLYCSGVDPSIKTYCYTPIKKENQIIHKWVKSVPRNIHDNDVRAMVYAGIKLVSGGIDGYLTTSSYPPKTLAKYGPFLQGPCAIIADEARLILFKYFNFLEIWKLGSKDDDNEILHKRADDDNPGTEYLHVKTNPEKLLELRSLNDEPIVCTSLSPNGRWLIYSTASKIRIYRFDVQDVGPPQMRPIKNLPKYFSPCINVIFSPDSTMLFLAKSNGHIDVFNLTESNEVDHHQTIETEKSIKDLIHILNISNCGKYFCCAGRCNSIVVYTFVKKTKRDTATWKKLVCLPRYKLPAMAVAFRPYTSLLTAVFADNKIFEYDLETLEFKFSTIMDNASYLLQNPVNNVIFDPRNQDIFILHTNSAVFTLNKNNENERAIVEETPKRNKINNGSTAIQTSKTYESTLITKYEHLVHLSWLGRDEIVAVEVNPVTLIEQLPPVFRKKKFGAS